MPRLTTNEPTISDTMRPINWSWRHAFNNPAVTPFSPFNRSCFSKQRGDRTDKSLRLFLHTFCTREHFFLIRWKCVEKAIEIIYIFREIEMDRRERNNNWKMIGIINDHHLWRRIETTAQERVVPILFHHTANKCGVNTYQWTRRWVGISRTIDAFENRIGRARKAATAVAAAAEESPWFLVHLWDSARDRHAAFPPRVRPARSPLHVTSRFLCTAH